MLRQLIYHPQVMVNKAIRYFVVHIMQMELFLLLVALILLPGYAYICTLQIFPFSFINAFGFYLFKYCIYLDLLRKYWHLQVWSAFNFKPNSDDSEQPIHEMDLLSGHENDVNYVQFRLALLVRYTFSCFTFYVVKKILIVFATSICSGCSVASKFLTSDSWKEENTPKFRNSWSINVLMLIFLSYFYYPYLVFGITSTNLVAKYACIPL